MHYKFHVNGMHCHACELLIEENFAEVGGIESVKADLAKQEVEIVTDLPGVPAEIAKQLTERIKEHGYTLSLVATKGDKNWKEFAIAAPVALAIIAGFFLLQKSGVINLSFSSEVSFGTAFFIGLIASASTCLAVVGGLVLSIAANYAKGGAAARPQLFFHGGRLASFFIFGGIIGVVGSTFHLSIIGSLILGLVVALVMIILGINLLNVFHSAKRFEVALPKFFSRGIMRLSTASHWFAPLIVGIATFFLPCGFTQSMQIYTLTTGSFMTGGLTMLAFALGTLPVLALLSFGAFSVAHKSWKGVFFKAAGIIVIAMALFNALNALAVAGIINPLFNF